MAAEAPAALVLPSLPKVSIPSLRPKKLPVGARVVHFVKTKQGTVPEKFGDSCTRCDNLRDQLCDATEILPDRFPVFAEYVKILQTLTTGLDVSKAGVGIAFCWNDTTFYDVEFDIVCMGFNIIVGLLTAAARQDISTGDGQHVIFHCLAGAKGIYEKIITMHKEAFNPVVPFDQLNTIGAALDALYVYFQLNVAISKNQKKGLCAKLAKTAAKALESVPAQTKELVMLLNFAATIFMFYDRNDNADYGVAVSFGRKAKSMFPKDKDLKKLPEPIRNAMKTLFTPFEPVFTTADKENNTIYLMPAPAEPPEIPVITAGTVCPAKFQWDVEVDVKPFQGAAAGTLQEAIDKRRKNFTNEIDRALHDIDCALKVWPQETVEELHQLITNLYAQRTLARELTEEVSKILGARSQAVSARFPMMFQHFSGLRSTIDQAANTDLVFETKFGQAQSLISGLDTSRQALTKLKGQIIQIREAAELALSEAEKSASSTNLDTVLAASQKLSATFEQLAGQLNPVFGEVAQHVAAMKQGSEKVIPPYQAEIAQVRTGFQQACNWYPNINKQLQTIKTQLVGI